MTNDSDIKRLYEKLDKIEDKLDQKLTDVDGKIDCVEKQLIVYNEELKRHIEGVNIARQENKDIRSQLNGCVVTINKRIDPIEDMSNKVKNISSLVSGSFGFILKVLGAVSVIIGIVIGIMKLI